MNMYINIILVLTILIIILILILSLNKKEKYESTDCINGNCGKILLEGKYIINYTNKNIDNTILSLSLYETKEGSYKPYFREQTGTAKRNLAYIYTIPYETIGLVMDLYTTYDSDKQIRMYSKFKGINGYYLNIDKNGIPSLTNTKQPSGFDIVTYYDNVYFIKINNIDKYINLDNYNFNNFQLVSSILQASKFNVNIVDYESVQTTGNNGTCPCANYCGYDWNQELSKLGWKGSVCASSARNKDGYELDCSEQADTDISCLCIRDDNQGFQKYGYDGSDCSSGQPKLN